MERSHFIPPASALSAFGPPTFIWMALDHWAALDHLDHQAGSEKRADIESQVYFNHTACVNDSMILHTQPETFLVPQPPKTLHPSLYSVILLKVPVFFALLIQMAVYSAWCSILGRLFQHCQIPQNGSINYFFHKQFYGLSLGDNLTGHS